MQHLGLAGPHAAQAPAAGLGLPGAGASAAAQRPLAAGPGAAFGAQQQQAQQPLSRPATPLGAGRSTSPSSRQQQQAHADDVFGSLVGSLAGAAIRPAQPLSLDEQRRLQMQQQQPQQQQRSGQLGASTASSTTPSAFGSPTPAGLALGALRSASGSPAPAQPPAAGAVAAVPLMQPMQPAYRPVSSHQQLQQQQRPAALHALAAQPVAAGVPLPAATAAASPSPPHATLAAADAFADLAAFAASPHSRGGSAAGANASRAGPAPPMGSLLAAAPTPAAAAVSVHPMQPAVLTPSLSPQSLPAQIQQQQQQQHHQSGWDNLDFLASPPNPTGITSSSASSSPAKDALAGNIDIFDVSYLGAQSAKSGGSAGPSPLDDNPLGILAAPIVAQDAKQQPRPQRQPSPRSQTATADAAPPRAASRSPAVQDDDRDFAIAQIVSMGFDADNASDALDAAGGDVSAAIDMLVQTRQAEKQLRRPASPADRDSGDTRPDHHQRVRFRDDPQPSDHKASADDAEPREQYSGADMLGGPNAQKIIATASAFGMSMFKNAKTIIDISRKKITEAIEKADVGIAMPSARRAGGSEPSGFRDDPAPPEGYQQWMGKPFKDYDDDDSGDNDERHGDGSQLHSPRRAAGAAGASGASRPAAARPSPDRRSSDESDKEIPLRRSNNSSASTSPAAASVLRPAAAAGDLIGPATGDLLGGDAPSVPVSAPALPMQAAPPQAQQAPKQPPRQPQPSSAAPPARTPAKPQRPQVHASPEQVAMSNDFKEKGNTLFKQGQFGDAESAYTKAIESLPTGHELVSVLLNNRAAARLKTGSYKEAVADCDAVQALEPGDPKSLLRRATAYEALEKWSEARDDYRTLMTIDASIKGVSVGLARCNKALAQDGSGEAAQPSAADMHGLGEFASQAQAGSAPVAAPAPPK
ncbi:auxilin-like clathrin-binding protein required for normal clathrin function [Polyrhizophydium stewartii]|uniref:Auxilin-like clathrin-binding protein required for normal clathrin function n=1 Tax=Polyrhizophydium stewartii TaxID=2732419 RepID=A0ABR4NGG8_9FUNG